MHPSGMGITSGMLIRICLIWVSWHICLSRIVLPPTGMLLTKGITSGMPLTLLDSSLDPNRGRTKPIVVIFSSCSIYLTKPALVPKKFTL